MTKNQAAYSLLPSDVNLQKSIQIIQIILSNRKVSGIPCTRRPYCPLCSDGLFEKISPIVSSKQPIIFIIPAFPFPMPNPRKTIGIPTPDHAELLSILHLQKFCARIQSVYPPGAKILIAADGDVLRPVWSYWFPIQEDIPAKYISGLNQMIHNIDAQDVIRIWSLGDAYGSKDINKCRDRLLADYPLSIDKTRAQIKQPNSVQNLAYIGQKKYFTNDGYDSSIGSNMSRTKVKRISGELAVQATHLAEAWSHRIAIEFPYAIRLSVHPYPAHFGAKTGIFLTETHEEWMTPWHGVAVYYTLTGKWQIMKNYKAKEIGGILVHRSDGQPDYYTINTLPTMIGKH